MYYCRAVIYLVILMYFPFIAYDERIYQYLFIFLYCDGNKVVICFYLSIFFICFSVASGNSPARCSTMR